MNDSSTILLFGMPRSGTSWIGKIFDSHPITLYRHEPDSWGLLNNVPFMASIDEVDRYAPLIRSFLSNMPRMKQTKVAGSTPAFPKQYVSSIGYLLFRLNLFSAKAAAKIFGEWPVYSPISDKNFSRTRLVWKSVESLGRLGIIERSIRPSYGIHIIRHPCGYISSVVRGESQNRFTSDLPSSEDVELLRLCIASDTGTKYGLSIEDLKAMLPVERLAWRWVLFNDKAMQDIEGESNCMTLRYEDLCDDPIGTSKHLFQFTKLPWSAQTERFVGQSTSRDVRGYYSVVKNPAKAASKWKNDLAKVDIDRIYNVVSSTRPGSLYRGE
jgi:hypothetical protein